MSSRCGKMRQGPGKYQGMIELFTTVPKAGPPGAPGFRRGSASVNHRTYLPFQPSFQAGLQSYGHVFFFIHLQQLCRGEDRWPKLLFLKACLPSHQVKPTTFWPVTDSQKEDETEPRRQIKPVGWSESLREQLRSREWENPLEYWCCWEFWHFY